MIDPNTVMWKETRHRGLFIHPLWRDAHTGDTAILIRMKPDCAYPRHRHIGPEDVYVLQGGLRDEHCEVRAGEFRRYPAGSSHHPVAIQCGEDCIIFAIAHGGIELL